MPVDRLLPTEEAADLIVLVRDIADKVLTPIVDAHEKAESYPEGVFAPTRCRRAAEPAAAARSGAAAASRYEVYLQVLEEIAARWAASAVGVSVHSLSSSSAAGVRHRRAAAALAARHAVRRRSSAPTACPSRRPAPTRRRCDARPGRDDDGYVINGDQGVDHPRRARRLLHAVRPHRRRRHAASPASWCPPTARAVVRQARGEDGPARAFRPRRRSTTTPASTPTGCIGEEGQGLQIALSALDSGRLGIAAVAIGLAQAALDEAIALRQRANDVRPQDHRPPGPGVPARRHGRRGRSRPGDLPRRRAPHGRRAGRTRRRPASPS